VTAITMRFEGVYERILDAMKKSGLAKSKAEAVRLALFKTAVDYGLISQDALFDVIHAETRKRPLSVEEIAEGIEYAKKAAVRG